ncbi:MAG TPA: hypothetical protein VF199_13265 [Bacillales bacterium]
MLKSGFKWMFLIMGTTIGAGYASGREIWQFFGPDSVLAILLFAVLFSICCFVIMKISYEYGTVHYIPVLQALLGRKLTSVYDIMIVLYLFTTTVIMLAGGGAALEMIKIPYWAGIAIISGLVICLFLWDIKGLLSMNTFIIPVLIILLIGVLSVFFFSDQNGTSTSLWHLREKWPAALTFTAFNILALVAVLSGVGREIQYKGEIWIASVGSGVILGAISLLYNQSLLKVSNDMMLYEIPLFAILKHYPYYMVVVMSALLWSAIYTTAASGVFGLITRVRERLKWPLWLLAFVFVLAMVPLTKFGFATLIAVLYPIYGVLNLYILAAILIYPIVRRYRLS